MLVYWPPFWKNTEKDSKVLHTQQGYNNLSTSPSYGIEIWGLIFFGISGHSFTPIIKYAIVESI